MKRISANKARIMVEGGLIEEIKHVNFDGTPEASGISECAKIVETVTRDLLQFSPDYYRIGSYLNLRRRGGWTHHISVFYYGNIKGGEEK